MYSHLARLKVEVIPTMVFGQVRCCFVIRHCHSAWKPRDTSLTMTTTNGDSDPNIRDGNWPINPTNIINYWLGHAMKAIFSDLEIIIQEKGISWNTKD